MKILIKKVNLAVDLMSSGSGIPWEDRGSRGFVGALFSTIFAMMYFGWVR